MIRLIFLPALASCATAPVSARAIPAGPGPKSPTDAKPAPKEIEIPHVNCFKGLVYLGEKPGERGTIYMEACFEDAGTCENTRAHWEKAWTGTATKLDVAQQCVKVYPKGEPA